MIPLKMINVQLQFPSHYLAFTLTVDVGFQLDLEESLSECEASKDLLS